jgi:demethylspheroidene O-methyltransferase
VLDAVSLDGRRHLLDVGGGEGGFVSAAARRHPHLALSLLDLPPVATRARRRLAEAGLGGRVTVHGGDFQADALPEGADVVSLVRVCLDHDDATVRALPRARCARRCRAVGRSSSPSRSPACAAAETVGDVYFGFYLWAWGAGARGASRSCARCSATRGFRQVRVRPTRYPVQVGVMVGTA